MPPDLVGGLIEVPDPTVDGVFPFISHFPCVRVVAYDYVVHRIGLKKEQRILRRKLGHSWRLTLQTLYTSMTPEEESTLATLWAFYDDHRNPRTLFYFYDPRESSEVIDLDGSDPAGRYTCRFLESELTFETFRDRLHQGALQVVAVDISKTEVSRLQYYPSRTMRLPTASWLAQASEAALISDTSIIHFASFNQVSGTGGLAANPLRVSTHRYSHVCTFGVNPTDTHGLYLPRLISWDFQQELNESDSGTLMVDDADLCISQYLEQVNITGWEMKFIIHVYGALGDHGEPVQFWRGYVADWERDSNEGTITFRFDGAANRLSQMLPHRLVSLSCPLEFDDNPAAGQLAECPYSLLGSGGDPDTCDKSLDGAKGCVSHGMKRFFQGFVVKPTRASGLLPRSHWYSLGRESYNVTSTALQTVYGQVIPYIYGAGKQIIDAMIFEFRDESEFKAASGILGEGPIGYSNQSTYPNAIGQVLLDGLPNHLGYEPVRAYGYLGQEVGTCIDTSFRCSRLAFVSIRAIDEVGFGENDAGAAATQEHRILVEVNFGLPGVRTYWWTGDLTLTREAYGGPVHYCYDLFLRALNLRWGGSTGIVGGNDDQPRDQLIDVDSFLAMEAWQATLVPSITDPTKTEELWRFRGALKEQRPAIDWMRQVMACCPIDIVFSFGKLNFKPRRDDVTVPKANMMVFEQAQNIIDKSFSAVRLKPKYNAVAVTYADEAFDSMQQTITIEDKAAQKRMGLYKMAGNYLSFVPNVLKHKLDLVGVFSRSQMIRLATQLLREELGGKTEAEQEDARAVKFSAPLMGMGVEIGDVFRVVHEELPNGAGFFRCTHFRYTADLACEIEGRSVVPSMYESTPDMIPQTPAETEPVKGVPGGSQGSDGSENLIDALPAPELTVLSESYRLCIVGVSPAPPLTHYLVTQLSDVENSWEGASELIYDVPVVRYNVAGNAGDLKYARAKWRRTSDPYLEEGPWSNVVTLHFWKIRADDIDLPDLYENAIFVNPETPQVGEVIEHEDFFEIHLRQYGNEGALVAYNQTGADWNPEVIIQNRSSDPSIGIKDIEIVGGLKDQSGFFVPTTEDLDYYHGVLPPQGAVTYSNYANGYLVTVNDYGTFQDQGRVMYMAIEGRCPKPEDNQDPELYHVNSSYHCKSISGGLAFTLGDFSYDSMGGPKDPNGVPTGPDPIIKIRVDSRAITVFVEALGRTVFPPTMPGGLVTGYYGTLAYDNDGNRIGQVAVTFTTGKSFRLPLKPVYYGWGLDILPQPVPPHPLEDYFVFVCKQSMDNFDVFPFLHWYDALEFGASLGEVSIEIASRSDRFVIGSFRGRPLEPGVPYYVKVGARRPEKWNNSELMDYAYSPQLSDEVICYVKGWPEAAETTWKDPVERPADLPADSQEGDTRMVNDGGDGLPVLYYYHDGTWWPAAGAGGGAIQAWVGGQYQSVQKLKPGTAIGFSLNSGELTIANSYTPPQTYDLKSFVWVLGGEAAVGQLAATFYATQDGTFDSWQVFAVEVGNGAVIIDIKKNGVSIITYPPYRILLTSGNSFDSGNHFPNGSTFDAGDIFTCEITQIGSVAPSGLTIQLNWAATTDTAGANPDTTTPPPEDDLVEVTSLGDPGDGDPALTYLLTKDEKMYTLNSAGTLWIPLTETGWPRHGGSDDTEFESGETTWTWSNQDGASASWDGYEKSKLTLYRTSNSSAGNFSFYKRSAPTSVTDMRLMVQLCLRNAFDGPDYNCSSGLCVKNTSNGRLVVFRILPNYNNVGTALTFIRWNSETSYGGFQQFGQYVFAGLMNQPIVLSMRFDSTNLYCEWAPWAGGREEQFTLFYSEAISTFIGQVNEMGINFDKQGGTEARAVSDWFRVIAA